MKVKGLDGCFYAIDLRPGPPRREDCSAGHKRARELLGSLYPLYRRLEEVPLPGTGGLSADFFIPLLRLMVEVQGVQHTRPVGFFHGDVTGYYRGVRADKRKEDFCVLNNIRLVALPYDESDERWGRRILGLHGDE